MHESEIKTYEHPKSGFWANAESIRTNGTMTMIFGGSVSIAFALGAIVGLLSQSSAVANAEKKAAAANLEAAEGRTQLDEAQSEASKAKLKATNAVTQFQALEEQFMASRDQFDRNVRNHQEQVQELQTKLKRFIPDDDIETNVMNNVSRDISSNIERIQYERSNNFFRAYVQKKNWSGSTAEKEALVEAVCAAVFKTTRETKNVFFTIVETGESVASSDHRGIKVR